MPLLWCDSEADTGMLNDDTFEPMAPNSACTVGTPVTISFGDGSSASSGAVLYTGGTGLVCALLLSQTKAIGMCLPPYMPCVVHSIPYSYTSCPFSQNIVCLLKLLVGVNQFRWYSVPVPHYTFRHSHLRLEAITCREVLLRACQGRHLPQQCTSIPACNGCRTRELPYPLPTVIHYSRATAPGAYRRLLSRQAWSTHSIVVCPKLVAKSMQEQAYDHNRVPSSWRCSLLGKPCHNPDLPMQSASRC